jgi:hypothetical protein
LVLELAAPAAEIARGHLGREVDADGGLAISTDPSSLRRSGHRARRRLSAATHDGALEIDALPMSVVG